MHLNYHCKEGSLPFVDFWQLENIPVKIDEDNIKVERLFTKEPNKNDCVIDESFSPNIV